MCTPVRLRRCSPRPSWICGLGFVMIAPCARPARLDAAALHRPGTMSTCRTRSGRARCCDRRTHSGSPEPRCCQRQGRLPGRPAAATTSRHPERPGMSAELRLARRRACDRIRRMPPARPELQARSLDCRWSSRSISSPSSSATLPAWRGCCTTYSRSCTDTRAALFWLVMLLSLRPTYRENAAQVASYTRQRCQQTEVHFDCLHRSHRAR